MQSPQKGGFCIYVDFYTDSEGRECIFLFLSLSRAVADRQERLFVTWVFAMTPGRQELLWCRCGISLVAPDNYGMDFSYSR